MEIGIIHQARLYELVKTTRPAADREGNLQRHLFDLNDTNLMISDLELVATIRGTYFKTAPSHSMGGYYGHVVVGGPTEENKWWLVYHKEGFNCFWLENEDKIRRYELATQADYAIFLSLVNNLEGFQSIEDNDIHLYNKKKRI